MAAPPAYEATTRKLTVRVRPQFLPEQSDPEARHWIITDGLGRVEHVEGPGVVGDQPTLRPGQRYSYTSGCPLPTTSGSMVGEYRMVTDLGEQFDIAIPAFSLDLPTERRIVN